MSNGNAPDRNESEKAEGKVSEKRRLTRSRAIKASLLAVLIVLVASVVGLQSKYDISTRAANVFELGTSGNIDMEAGSYSGELKGGVIEGEGTFKFLSGEEYEGSWLDYKIDGWGELKHPGAGTYSGDYSDGKRSGEGTFEWENGDRYTGHWENDAFNGVGTYSFADGSSLHGEFVDGDFVSGEHSFVNEAGDYTVKYESGSIVGFNVVTEKGVYSLDGDVNGSADAKIELESGLKYEGSISEGLFEGEGTLTYPSGHIYTGSFSGGVRSGNGTYKWSDGASYDGNWENDKANGKGTYYYPTKSKGEKLVGKFKKGKPSGSCTYYDKKGKHYKTKWKDGKCVKIWE